MKPLTTEKEIASYQQGVERAVAGLDHYLEAGYLHIEQKYFVKGKTLDTNILETAKGRLAVANDIVDRLSKGLEPYLGFTLDNDQQRRIAFKNVYGSSPLEFRIHFANEHEAIAKGHIREVFAKKKQEIIQRKHAQYTLGIGLHQDKKTGKLIKIQEQDHLPRMSMIQETEE